MQSAIEINKIVKSDNHEVRSRTANIQFHACQLKI